MTLEAFDADDLPTPSWLSGRLALCIGWINDLEVEDALKALLVARASISETAPDLKNLVESQVIRLEDQAEFQVLRLPWLERSERLKSKHRYSFSDQISSSPLRSMICFLSRPHGPCKLDSPSSLICSQSMQTSLSLAGCVCS